MAVEVPVSRMQSDGAIRLLDFGSRLRRSAAHFADLVWPRVSAVFGPGHLSQVEALESDCARTLDLLGIDYLFDPDCGEAFGIASRIQAPDRSGRPWDSFTMSAHQYNRLQAIEASAFGRLVPAVVVHAFVDEDPKLLSVGVARIRDLVNTTPTGSNLGPSGPFYTWSFDDLRAAGRLIARLPDPSIADPFTPVANL